MYPLNLLSYDPDFSPFNRILEILNILKNTEHVIHDKTLITISVEFIVIPISIGYIELRDPKEWPLTPGEMIYEAMIKIKKVIEEEDLRVEMTSNADTLGDSYKMFTKC